MNDTAGMRFTRSHEWVLPKGRSIRVGITDYAQHLLGDVTHVDLPVPDEHHFEAREEIAVIESLRTTFDCHAPVAGRIVGINNDLLARPELVSEDPYDTGWLFELIPDDAADVDDLMDVDEYEGLVPEEEEE